MDPRHETKMQVVLNHIISNINDYVTSHIDFVLNHPTLDRNLIKIIEWIETFSGQEIEAEALLSRQNLLSVDRVLIPHIEELNVSNPQEFMVLLNKIDALIQEERALHAVPDIYVTLHDIVRSGSLLY